MSEAAVNFLSTKAAAAYPGLSHRTLEGYRARGEGPVFHRFANRARYLTIDLDPRASKRSATTTEEADRRLAV